jgi:outer membrane protein OmpA-like peptidoglycan-associated protein
VENEKRGLVVRLGEVFFDFDSHNLKESSKTSLEKVSEILKTRYKDREIVVEGFTDSIGESDYNKKLSERRARSVASFMKGKISNDKLSYRGLGEEMPIADNSTDDGRQKNRRVDIIIRME